MASIKKNLELMKKDVLQPEEETQYYVDGVYKTKNGWTKNGVLVATNKRLVFYSKKMIGYDFENFNYNRISTFEISKRTLGYTITFYSSGNEVFLKWIQNGNFQKFVDYVNNRIENLNDSQQSGNDNAPSNLSKIKELKELLDMGAITEEEYNKKKEQLLNI